MEIRICCEINERKKLADYLSKYYPKSKIKEMLDDEQNVIGYFAIITRYPIFPELQISF